MALNLQRVRPIITGLTISSISAGILIRYFSRDVHADSSTAPKVFGKGPAFVSLPLESSEQVNHNTKLLRFKLPNPDATSGLSVTSAVLTLSWPKSSWLPVARPYTPISPLDAPGFLDLLVKHYPGGKQSTHLHTLQPGESLLFAAALRGPRWTPNAASRVTLIAGGAGITPVFQLTQAMLTDPEDKTPITLVYGANEDEDVLLRPQLDAWAKTFGDRFRVVYTVTRPAEGSPFRKGHVTKELLEEVVGERIGEGMVYVCGPPPMEKMLVGSRRQKGVLEELGYRKEQVKTF